MPNDKKSLIPTRTDKKILKNQENLKNQADSQQEVLPKLSPDLKYLQKICSNIIEVTEEHDTQRFNTQTIEQVSKLIKKNQVSIWQKMFSCFKFFIPCFKKQPQFSIVVKEKQLLKTIQKLRTQNLKIKPILPPLESNKKTLVLDIDQNLVYSSQTQIQKYDFTFKMPYKKSEINVYSKIRFGLESFLFEMSKIYEIVVYTTNFPEYVQEVLKNIDKKKRISHVLLKEKCLNINKVHFLKSLKALGRDPQRVIFIDHNLASGLLQPKNFLQLRPYSGQKHDRQLVKLIPFLRELAQKQSVIPVNKQYEEFCNRQIRLKFNSIDKSKSRKQETNFEVEDKQNDYEERRRQYSRIMAGKKKKYGHKRTNSEFENLAENKENEPKIVITINEKKMEQQEQTQQTQQSQLQLRPRNLNIQQAI